MQFKLNGQATEIKANHTVRQLVDSLKLNAEYLVAELNGKLLEKTEWETKKIQENDVLELIRFVGGGLA